MVAAVRRGMALREASRRFKLALSTVQRWVRRAHGRALPNVDWADRSHAPHRRPHRCPEDTRGMVVAVRAELAQGALGFVGALAIHEQLQGRLGASCPSVRTIGRMLRAEGLVGRARRLRQAPPPQGWYLPAVAARQADLDSCDYIEDLRIEGGPFVQVLTVRGLWAPAAGAWTSERSSAAHTCQGLLSLWRRHGRPRYVQFDNGAVFQGARNRPDIFGMVTRFCMALGVTPVFAPPAEHGAQNLIESFNALWQQKVWQRFHHPSAIELQRTSDRFISAWCARRLRRDNPVPRAPLAPSGRVDLRRLPPGTIIYLRRCNDAASLAVLGHRLQLPPVWAHRLVRVEVDLSVSLIRCYGLRRADPLCHPLLLQRPYSPTPRSSFQTKLTCITWH